MTIKLFLSQTDSRPMYLQIMSQIKQKVMVGDWQAGFHLPSIREMASATGVSVITVKRAYLELEREGVIYTQQGRGSFVAENDSVQQQLLEAQLDDEIRAVIDSARQMGLSDEQLMQRLETILKSVEKA